MIQFEKVLRVFVYIICYTIICMAIDEYLDEPIQNWLMNHMENDFLHVILYYWAEWQTQYGFQFTDYCCGIGILWWLNDYFLRKVVMRFA